MDFVEIYSGECIHQEMKILRILSLYHMRFRNYDHQKYGSFSLDTKPLKFLAFWNCFYSAIFNRKYMKFGLAIHFHTMLLKTSFSWRIYKTSLWWSAKILKITALIFFFPFSESSKFTRKNPNMLKLIVVYNTLPRIL